MSGLTSRLPSIVNAMCTKTARVARRIVARDRQFVDAATGDRKRKRSSGNRRVTS
jgi:hypothetical protein